MQQYFDDDNHVPEYIRLFDYPWVSLLHFAMNLDGGRRDFDCADDYAMMIILVVILCSEYLYGEYKS